MNKTIPLITFGWNAYNGGWLWFAPSEWKRVGFWQSGSKWQFCFLGLCGAAIFNWSKRHA